MEVPNRYHGLDALRGIAMLLGIVIHSALPYIPNVEGFWPTDASSSQLINIIFHFIHLWRMPLFFILAGFFARLVITRKSWRSWWRNRLLRIGLPVVVFSPLMSLTLPWIFHYGKTGEFLFFYSTSGQPFHLWFLWQLIILIIITVISRFLYLGVVGVSLGLYRIRLGLVCRLIAKSKFIFLSILFRSRFPIAFIIVCCVISLPTNGELIFNPLASGLYFMVGFSLHANPRLFSFLKAYWGYYLLAGFVSFSSYMILESMNIVTDTYSENLTNNPYLSTAWEGVLVLLLLLKTICAILISYAFIGLSERKFNSYSPNLRFISDGAYCIYLIHLPIVTLITFFMFNLSIPIEVKFLTAIVTTSIICLGTYKYFVRSTLIGVLLNGQRKSR